MNYPKLCCVIHFIIIAIFSEGLVKTILEKPFGEKNSSGKPELKLVKSHN